MSSMYRPAAMEDRLSVNYFRIPVKIVQLPHVLFATAAFLTTAITIAWSFWYQVPEYAMADGIVIVPGSIVQIKTNLEGVNIKFQKEQGFQRKQEFKQGATIAEFESRQLDIEIDNLKDAIEFLETNIIGSKNDFAKKAHLVGNALTKDRIAKTQRMIKKYSPLIKEFDKEIEDLERANRESPYRGTGFPAVNPGVIKDKTQERLNLQNQEHDLRTQLSELELELTKREFELKDKQKDWEKELEEKAGELKEKEMLRELRVIKAPYDGRVLSFSKVDGDLLSKGDVVCKLIRTDRNKENQKCVAYFDVGAGSKIALGDLAYVTPSTHLREKDGSIRGIVTKTNEFLSSPDSAAALLGHDELAETLQNDTSNLKEIEICLLNDFQMHVVKMLKSQTRVDLLDRNTFECETAQEQVELLQDLNRQKQEISKSFEIANSNKATVSIELSNRTPRYVEITRNQFQQFKDYAWVGSAPSDFTTIEVGTTAKVRIQIGSEAPVAFAYATLGKWLGNSDSDRLPSKNQASDN